MTPLRIAMVTRRFWPLVGGAEMVMANLSQQFLAQGARPVIGLADRPGASRRAGGPVAPAADPGMGNLAIHAPAGTLADGQS